MGSSYPFCRNRRADARGRRVSLRKRLEDLLERIRRHADSRIHHTDIENRLVARNLIAALTYRRRRGVVQCDHDKNAPLTGELDGVAEQIQENLS